MSTVRANTFLDGAGGNTATINGKLPIATEDVPTALNASGSAPIYACRAWVNFNGTGTVAIRASGNVSSITDNGVGDYTVNFTTAMPDANYAVVTTASDTEPRTVHIQTRATSSVRIRTGAGSWSVFDSPEAHVAIFR